MLVTRRNLLASAGAAVAVALVAAHAPVLAAAPRRILLINPNSNRATTDMMVRIAQAAAPEGIELVGATAPNSPLMIVDADTLAASAPQVVEIGLAAGTDVSGIIVSAFGDPGLADLRRQVGVPVVGIAEAAMLAAADKDRRFGVATVTPKLVGSIDAKAAGLGLARLYTGTRLTSEDPNKLVADPALLVEALRQAVAACIELDHAEAVVIGGGPLGNAATALAPMFSVPVIAPIPTAMHRMMALLDPPQK